MPTTTRKYTNLLLEAVSDGVLDAEQTLANLLGYLSEAQVAAFVSDELVDDTDEDEDEDPDYEEWATALAEAAEDEPAAK